MTNSSIVVATECYSVFSLDMLGVQSLLYPLTLPELLQVKLGAQREIFGCAGAELKSR